MLQNVSFLKYVLLSYLTVSNASTHVFVSDTVMFSMCVYTYTYMCVYIYMYVSLLMAQWSRINLPAQEMWVQSLSREDTLEEGMATHSSLLARRIPWTEEPGRLQSTVSQRVGHN